MPRILGVDIPNDKPTHISLRYIYGIGPTTALRLCEQAKIDPQRRAKELSDDDLAAWPTILDREYTVEGPLRRQMQQNMHGSATSAATAACAIAAACRCAASAPAPTPAPARARARRSPARRASRKCAVDREYHLPAASCKRRVTTTPRLHSGLV